MSSVDSSLVLPLKAMVPSRITLIRSAIWRISGSLCEIKTIPTPVASSSCKRLNKRSVSAGVSEAVVHRGSESASRASAARISTIWRSAIPRSCQTMQIKLAAQRRQQVSSFSAWRAVFCQPKQDVFFYRQAWEKQRFLGNEINTQLMSMNWR